MLSARGTEDSVNTSSNAKYRWKVVLIAAKIDGLVESVVIKSDSVQSHSLRDLSKNYAKLGGDYWYGRHG